MTVQHSPESIVANVAVRVAGCFGVLVAVWLMLFAGSAVAIELGAFFKRPDQRAIEMLENGQPEAAANTFKDPQWRGVSRYKAGLYDEALEDFSTAEDADGLYNHGTAAARAGDYTQAVASLEQALKLAPDDTNIAHNLEIARKLKELAEEQSHQNQQDQNSQEQNQQDQGSEGDEKDSNQQDESGQQGVQEEPSQEKQGDEESDQDGEQNQSGEQDQGTEQDQRSDQGQPGSQQTNGETETDEEEQEKAAEDLREMMQQEQSREEQSKENPQQAQQQAAAPAVPDSVSEDDQATEQWLRRIPDDASQLLRNKIRLNHAIEYRDVQDLQEPW